MQIQELKQHHIQLISIQQALETQFRSQKTCTIYK